MRIGIKSGTFRILTPGHIWALNYCAARCDYLIVLTNSDEYLLRKKGSCPIKLLDRLTILSSLKMIDEIGWFPEDTEDSWIELFKYSEFTQFPDPKKLIVFHSIETQNKEYIPAKHLADEIIYVPRVEGSTTKIIEDLKNG